MFKHRGCWITQELSNHPNMFQQGAVGSLNNPELFKPPAGSRKFKNGGCLKTQEPFNHKNMQIGGRKLFQHLSSWD